LEQRLLLSGIGSGLNKKKVTFTDAAGDKVVVSLGGTVKGSHDKPTFNITLDGGASNDADIQSIVINGSDSATALSILVSPVKVKLPNTIPGMTTGRPYTFTNGYVDVALISSAGSLKGISANAAELDSIWIGSATSSANIGGIAIGVGKSQFFASAAALAHVELGNVTDYGSIGSIVLTGSFNAPVKMVGTISATDGIGSINAPFSDLTGPINVTGAPATGTNAGVAIGNLDVHDILANVTTMGSIMSIEANNLLGAIQTTAISGIAGSGAIGSLVLAGNFTGNVSAAGAFGNANVDGNWSGTLSAGSVGSLLINGTSFTGTVQSASNIGNILVSQSGVAFGANIDAVGNIGNLSAGAFSGANVVAGGNIGSISSTSVAGNLPAGLTAGIGGSTFQAGGNIGNVSSSASINGTTLIAGGAIGNITSTAGDIGGSMGWAQFLSTIKVNVTPTISLSVTGPAADFIEGGSIGNITAHGDISGDVITSTAGNIGNLTSQEGRIAFDTVTA